MARSPSRMRSARRAALVIQAETLMPSSAAAASTWACTSDPTVMANFGDGSPRGMTQLYYHGRSELFEREKRLVDGQLESRLDDHLGYLAVQAISGMGPVMAAIFVAEIGDVTRFPSARHLCSWAGLTPTVRSSDDKLTRGHISRQGNGLIRWAAVEAVARYHGGAAIRPRLPAHCRSTRRDGGRRLRRRRHRDHAHRDRGPARLMDVRGHAGAGHLDRWGESRQRSGHGAAHLAPNGVKSLESGPGSGDAQDVPKHPSNANNGLTKALPRRSSTERAPTAPGGDWTV